MARGGIEPPTRGFSISCVQNKMAGMTRPKNRNPEIENAPVSALERPLPLNGAWHGSRSVAACVRGARTVRVSGAPQQSVFSPCDRGVRGFAAVGTGDETSKVLTVCAGIFTLCRYDDGANEN
jgi:hypothetical protein